MGDEIRLKPCPWCGSPVRVVTGFGLYAVSCERFYCDREMVTFFETEQEAVDAWNRGECDD